MTSTCCEVSVRRSQRRPVGVRGARPWARLDPLQEHTQPQAQPQTLLRSECEFPITSERLPAAGRPFREEPWLLAEDGVDPGHQQFQLRTGQSANANGKQI